MISFAFDNAELINLLRQRGTYIKYENYDKMREVNNKIDAITADDHKRRELNRPVTAFITFSNEEGINRAKEYDETCENDERFKHF